MERSVAIKKLGKLIGKDLGYRVDPEAPDAAGRAEAQGQFKGLFAEKQAAEKAMTDRKMELLRGDTQYQELKAAYQAARLAADKMSSRAHRYKFTVGKVSTLFFS